MSTKLEATTKHPQLRLLFSAEEISRRVHHLAEQISLDCQGRYLVLVAVLKGAFVFLADLARHLTIPVEIDFVRLTSYGASTTSSGKVRILADVQFNLRNRDILIVEDIVDSGLTLNFLLQHFQAHKPRSLKISCLIDKAERRTAAVHIDYPVLKVTKGFLVGYGLDCSEAYRQLPHIYELIL